MHLAEFPSPPDPAGDATLLARWERLLELRETVNAALELKRKEKLIGNSLAAHVCLGASGDDLALLERHRDDLATLFIVSQVSVERRDGALAIDVHAAGGARCDRCWRVVRQGSTDPAHSGICSRCQDALAEPVNS